jgi:hypothetical protein
MRVNKWLVAGLGFVISAVFLWLAFRNLNPEAVLLYIREVDPLWLIVGSAVYFIAVALISLRWQFLLRASGPVRLQDLIPLVAIGYMGNNVYPFRSGEVLRIVLLQRQHKIPMARAATTVIVERVFDGLVMLTFIAVALLVVDVTSPEVRRIAMLTAPLFLTAVALFFIVAARPDWLRGILHQLGRFAPGRIRGMFSRLADEITEGLRGLRSPLDLAGAVLASFASWMVEASVYWMVSFAFNLGVSYAVMLLLVGVVNLAGLIPASPGQVGVFEFFVSLILIAVGIAEPQAHAYALVVHVVIWLPVTLYGFACLVRYGLGWGALGQARELEKAPG